MIECAYEWPHGGCGRFDALYYEGGTSIVCGGGLHPWMVVPLDDGLEERDLLFGEVGLL